MRKPGVVTRGRRLGLPAGSRAWAKVPHRIPDPGTAVDTNGVGLQGPDDLTARRDDANTTGSDMTSAWTTP